MVAITFYIARPRHLIKLRLHTVNKRRRMYWNYLERHPNHFPLHLTAEQEARDALAWFYLGTRFVLPSNQSQVLTPPQTISRRVPAALYHSQSRSARICSAQYPNLVVRSLPHQSTFLWTHCPRTSADSRDSSPGRTAFFSWLLKVLCTYVQCEHLSLT